MIDKGLDKDWLAEQKDKYETNLAAGKLSENAQALPRLELIRKILGMWPHQGFDNYVYLHSFSNRAGLVAVYLTV